MAEAVIGPEVVERTVEALVARHGAAAAARIRRGVEQVAPRWWAEDGDAQAFSTFCTTNFAAGEAALAAAFARMEQVAEQLDGHLHEARRELTRPLDLDLGPLEPIDQLLAGIDLAPHLDDDLFASRVAFLLLLNFPVHTLAERLAAAAGWDRETWARSRMMDRFALRVPAAVALEGSRAYTAAEQYISAYNIRMDRLVTAEDRPLFPEGLRLIAHWGLRDELASQYVAGGAEALARQRTILQVMERIVRQQVPAAVVDNGELLWDPAANRVRRQGGGAVEPDLAAPEPDTRYSHLLAIFHAQRRVDPYSPAEPTFMARRFERGRQMREAEAEELLAAVLDSPEVAGAARLIERRVGRPLEPFDIWFSGFKPRGRYPEAELDRVVRARFPDLAALQAALPELLAGLGFAPERARWLAERIVIDPARGAGHAMPAARREDAAHLRTRVPAGGMDYKGYNIAMHELGHNVEQVFSLNGIDHWWLSGVPNYAFTEALAFAFQKRDLELLGLAPPSPESERLASLATLWNTYEIAGVSLVDMRVWHWLYEHPDATAAALREATLAIAREIWNRYFAPRFGPHTEGSEILAIYSHMIVYGLYLPDYALGHLIEFQLAEKLSGAAFGAEFERVARQGRLTPDDWMRGAVGGPLSAQPLLAAARAALLAAAS